MPHAPYREPQTPSTRTTTSINNHSMYYIEKSFEISASHHLTLSYQSKCTQVHGHNWHVTVYCKARELNQDGMVADFGHIKAKVHGLLDHADLNKVLPF